MKLQTFDWAQVLATLALLVSFVTAYFSFFRKGRLKIRHGETLLLQLTETGRLRISPELAFHNPGSTLGIVHEISSELRRLADDKRDQMILEEFVTTVFDENTRWRDTRFAGYPSVLFIPKGEALPKRLMLVTEHPNDLAPGDYELSISVRIDGMANDQVTVTAKIRLDKSDVEFLKESNIDPVVRPMRRNLVFLFRRGPNTNCYMRKPQA